MRRAGLALAILFSLALPALAVDTGLGLMGVGSGAVAPTYTGPGDIVSSATAWYGLRAYNAAYATGSNNAVNVRRASDNSTQNIVILSNGNLDIATANTFAGTDATASCTIATTVATCTGASSTPHTGSTITGSGVQEPCFATSVGTFTGGAGTVNLGGGGTSPCGTISVAVTLTFQYGLFIPEAYDQTGNGNNVSQTTAANQPQLLPLCNNSLPCIFMGVTIGLVSSATFTPATGVVSFSIVGDKISGGNNNAAVIRETTNNRVGFSSSANDWALFTSGGTFLVTATDSAWHNGQFVLNGASTVVNIDGTETTGSYTGLTTATIYSAFVGAANTVPYATEAGFWDNLAFSPTQRTNLCHNEYTYWGTSTSC
jgi:hypothetical protein